MGDYAIVFTLIEKNFGLDYMYWTLYVINLIFSIVAYKLGFARELPLLKSIIVYIMLAIGVLIITVFSVFQLPMTETLVIVSLVLGIYRFRLHQDRQKKAQ